MHSIGMNSYQQSMHLGLILIKTLTDSVFHQT